MHPRSFGEQLVRFALSVFIAAALLYAAACLLQRVWPWLLGGGLFMAGLVAAAQLTRRRRERW